MKDFCILTVVFLTVIATFYAIFYYTHHIPTYRVGECIQYLDSEKWDEGKGYKILEIGKSNYLVQPINQNFTIGISFNNDLIFYRRMECPK